MKIHTLKTVPPYFQQVLEGKKTFEYRKNDRDYEVGDLLQLEEYDPTDRIHTGRETWVSVASMVRDAPEFGVPDGYCIMSIVRLDPTHKTEMWRPLNTLIPQLLAIADAARKLLPRISSGAIYEETLELELALTKAEML